MRSFQEAKSIAEAECTESTNKYRKTSRFAIRVLVVVIALGLRSVGVTEVITKHQQQQLVNLVVSPSMETPQRATRSAELGEKAATTICPDASARETHSCVITTSWSNKIKIGDPEANGMLLCALPGGAVLGKTYERLEENGTTFWRFRTEEGNVVKTYRLIRANEACPATL